MMAEVDAQHNKCYGMMNNNDNYDGIKAAILHVWEFLRDYIPLANTHGAEFLSHNHWNLFIPPLIGQILLALNDEELVKLPLTKITFNASKHNDNNKDSNCCGKCDRERDHFKKSKDMKNICAMETKLHVPTSTSTTMTDFRDGISIDENGLQAIISQAIGCHLENLGILTPSADAIVSPSNSKSIISEAMSEKKSHEVQLMSHAVAAIVGVCQADLVVDVGSGKGYLGMELADHQQIGVLGLDSCASNTHGAIVRKDKLAPRWSGLVAKGRKQDENKQDNCPQGDIEDMQKDQDQCRSMSNSFPKPTDCVTSVPDTKVASPSNLYVPLTIFVDPQMNLHKVISEKAIHLCSENKKVEDVKLVITGLHTCGSLAVSVMKLFIKNPGAVGMCCVGCCYQLMEEENEDCETGFPLSKFGKSQGLSLGRNARNLASQSMHRLQASKQLQGKDFYWRALLDVLLRDLSLPVPERITGMRKLHKKCTTFHEYAVMALEKLGYASDVITPEKSRILEEKYQREQAKIKMTAFFQYKLILAPVIESLILLDRLLFLIEQDCINQAFLVQLFNPVTSPRCYALVAYKSLEQTG